ncbi:site-specific integrase [Parabacteroides pacaensis]|uniref:site-specific integrase n=1 Tax=Parabacteroides pacaensis TaxID=2086575 RepID=UPI00131CA1CC|nr:site-specific integrase [Parabacteroides pacaensis]
MPTKYTKEEVEKIRLSIDRASKKGKRDYAIFLLAARLGLRSSDIRLLKFENLDWDKNIIKLDQYRTGKYIEIPLLSDVGNAIVNYLQYGRPASESSFVFLEAIYPYATISQGISKIFSTIFRNSGINIEGRKHGSHALRHSLAVRMLKENTILSVITEILRHENTNSTKYYLRIDITSLKKCALDILNVEPCFYTQKGGTFYE